MISHKSKIPKKPQKNLTDSDSFEAALKNEAIQREQHKNNCAKTIHMAVRAIDQYINNPGDSVPYSFLKNPYDYIVKIVEDGYRQAAEDCPDNPEWLAHYVSFLVAIGKHDEAADIQTKALQSYGFNFDLCLRYSQCYDARELHPTRYVIWRMNLAKKVAPVASGTT